MFRNLISTAIASMFLGAVSHAAINEPVRVESGRVSGTQGRDPSISVYRGIPYAQPPVGGLRFKPPQPVKAWQGVRKADQFGKMCAQNGDSASMSEDCLFLNVWTGAARSDERRPVLIWIYGGAFVGGSGANPDFDGESLAKKGVVVVTFNYRVGVFGFLATPELSKETGHNASGNAGLLDDIAVLKWVNKNIAAFGGDPKRITVGGQSAGAGSVGFLSMSPLAKGLFQRAIMESHARYSRDTELRYLSVSYRTLKNAEDAGTRYSESLGASSLAALRTLPWQRLVVPEALEDEAVDAGSDGKPPLFRPVVDGYVVPYNYAETFARHAQNDVAVLTGNNRDESGAVPENTFEKRRAAGNAALIPGMPRTRLTEASFVQAAQRKFGPLKEQFLSLYPAHTDDEAGAQNNASVRDNSRISTFLWASDWKPGTDKPVYTYFWTHRPTGDAGGAHHGSEVLFAFDNLSMRDRPWSDEDRKIAQTVSSYWVNFISNGDPNGAGLPRWPQFDASSATTMELGDQFAPIPVADQQKLAFWKSFFQTQNPW